MVKASRKFSAWWTEAMTTAAASTSTRRSATRTQARSSWSKTKSSRCSTWQWARSSSGAEATFETLTSTQVSIWRNLHRRSQRHQAMSTGFIQTSRSNWESWIESKAITVRQFTTTTCLTSTTAWPRDTITEHKKTRTRWEELGSKCVKLQIKLR